MTNLTQSQIAELIDFERAETNSGFISPTKTLALMNRCNRRIIAEPGVRTVPDKTTINFTGSGSHSLPSDVKSIKNLISGGPGNTAGTVEFLYLPPDEFDLLRSGRAYTFKEKGKIEIFANDTSSLPTTALTLNYWSKNIVLDADGTTKKALWSNVGDTSRLGAEYDEIWVLFCAAKIKKREGQKEWTEDWLLFKEMLDSLREEGGVPKPTRPMRAFGHYLLR